jgi:1,4-dihydroxy-6-naphthoate synthase
MKVAIPGRLTSAALALKMWNPSLETVILGFDEIMPAVREGSVDAGVVIHEGQLTWQDEGFSKIVDLGEWWAAEAGGLPLPLGGNVIRRDLVAETCEQAAALLKASIEHALANREQALAYALDYGRGLDLDRADRFVGMYVNELTVDYGERGRRAMSVFLERAFAEGLIPKVPQLDFL